MKGRPCGFLWCLLLPKVAAEDLWGEAFATSDESEEESVDWEEEEDEEREGGEGDTHDGGHEHDDVKNFRWSNGVRRR